MDEQIRQAITAAVKELYRPEGKTDAQTIEPVILTRPSEEHGDFASNVALKLAKSVGQQPRVIAEAIAAKLKSQNIDVSVAGAGFINIRLSDDQLLAATEAATSWPKTNAGRQVLVEFGNANPFKDMHLGHLYSTVIGDAIARLYEASGAEVVRLSYHGDVGMHVAQAIWAMLKDQKVQELLDRSEEELKTIAGNLGVYYAEGAKAYKSSEKSKEEINNINEHIYKRDDPTINRLHELGSNWSFEDFDNIFKDLGITHAENGRYLESQSEKIGVKIVKENIGKVFEDSEGAVVYKGEKVGLHTRVFINSRGLPTYEAKDLGLIELKNQDYPKAERSIIITAVEQNEYFKVMLAALRQIDPNLAEITTHLGHGFLTLTTGKMSSRSGDIHSADSLIEQVKKTILKQYPDTKEANRTYLAAIKYSLLKHRLGSNIVFNIKESVSLEGNSGPYLQYAHARARSILQKAGQKGGVAEGEASIQSIGQSDESIKEKAIEPVEGAKTKLQPSERSLARKITEFPEIVKLATIELTPHHIANYLFELAQAFNRFYENNRVIGDARQVSRLKLVKSYAEVLKTGLGILGITAPNHL